MKRYMLFLASLMILAPYGEADAKAVKLGRGRSYSVAIDTSVNSGANGTQVRKGECESNEECAADKKCMNYKCVDVCTQPTQSGMSLAPICAGQRCITDPDTPHAFKCVDACYNVQCLPGNTTEVTSSGCCCVALPCNIPSNVASCSACSYSDTLGENICTSATCETGYGWWATNSSGPTCNKCTVPSNASSCTACQYDATYGQKCTSAVCNSGYTWKSGIGGYSCQKTTTAQVDTGTCTVSSSRCCVNSLGTTVCPSGYTASGGTCVKGDEKMYCIAYATK